MLGCIYKISVGTDDFYIGSTFDFDERLWKHNGDIKIKKTKLYKAIRDNNCDFNMEKLHDYKCENETELRIEERRVYDELKPTLNMNRPFATTEEHAEHKKQYYKNNAIEINKKAKQYYIDNVDNIKTQKKQYDMDNIEKRIERDREYYLNNAEKVKAKQRQYNLDNAEINNEKARQKRALQRNIIIKCECGCDVRKTYLTKHKKTQKHINNI
tara:strand:+ start:80 stop:718 length:639 start_codon:yes stop_codon:yes gene_type:complete